MATALTGSLAASLRSSYGAEVRNSNLAEALNPRYPALDKILEQPVLK